MIWAIELMEFDITFKTRAAVKWQALADFVTEFIPILEINPVDPLIWNLFVDGSPLNCFRQWMSN